MENPITQLEQLTLANASKSFLRETAKWAKFLSIVGFVSIGFMILLAIFGSTIFSKLPNAETIPFDLGLVTTIVYLVIAALYFFPMYYLYQFSTRIKTALLTKNDDTLADAFEVLKSHYKFIGVLTVIMLSLFILLGVFFLAII